MSGPQAGEVEIAQKEGILTSSVATASGFAAAARVTQNIEALPHPACALQQRAQNGEKQPCPGIVNTFAELFARVDRHDNGSIRCSEMVKTICEDIAVADAFGIKNTSAKGRQQLEALFRTMDTDESGCVGLHEFCAYMAENFPDGSLGHLFGSTPDPASQAPAAGGSADQGVLGQLEPSGATVGPGLQASQALQTPTSPAPAPLPAQSSASVVGGSPSVQADPVSPPPPLPPSPPTTKPSARQHFPSPPSAMTKVAFEVEDLANFGDRDASEDSDDQFDSSEREHLSDDTDSSEEDDTSIEERERSKPLVQSEQMATVPLSVLDSTHVQQMSSPRGATEAARAEKQPPAPGRSKCSAKSQSPIRGLSAADRRAKLQRQVERDTAALVEQQGDMKREQEAVEKRAREARAKWLKNKALQRKVEQAEREKKQREEAEHLQQKREHAALTAVTKQESRAKELLARAASLHHDGVAELEPAHRQGEHLECVGRAVLRGGFELDSPHIGFIPVGERITVLEARINHRGQTRLRCSRGWTSAAAANGNLLFRPVPTMLESVPEEESEDDGQRNEPEIHRAAVNLLYDSPASKPVANGSAGSSNRTATPQTLDEVGAAVELAMSIETWLSTIEIGGSVPRRFDSAGLIQFGIEKRLYNQDPAKIYEQYVESMVAGAPPPTPPRTVDGGGWHGDGGDDHPLL